ncbi:major facilitator superfamily domain-containing protein [Truncatella angustata]|uniref:Major facilitator superfamily domain-containing protein n=1 Tax=Truncatella angustata TaxID=152316 RepID=A0A9P8U9X8_9PEZI|nr:major facilitator superfamily domain-containing protein [Truncatella angustata]KAH6646789.1 major facilitator superfamily domain-containing protein [Truncatella angustata]
MSSHDEQRPLLESSDLSGPRAPPHQHNDSTRRAFLTAVLCALIIFVYSLGSATMLTPMSKIFEDIICHNHARRQPQAHHALGEDRCKAPDVQSELASLQAWSATLEYIPGLLVAVPYGTIADRFGHKLVLSLSSTGVMLQMLAQIIICAFPDTLPLQLIWVTPVLGLIGGGTAVLISMIYAVANDNIPDSQRSTAFFYIGASAQLGQLLSSPIAYITMRRDVWLPVCLGFGLFVLATTLCMLIPSNAPELVRQSQRSVSPSACNAESIHRSSSWARNLIIKSGAALKWIAYDNRPVGYMLTSLLVTVTAKYAAALELQYITKRYDWSWEEAGLVVSARPITSLLLLTIVLPALGSMLLQRGFTPLSKDLSMARLSVFIFGIGSLLLGLAETRVLASVGIILMACGAGFSVLARSIISSLVAKERVGLLYTVISVIESIGSIAAGPLLLQFFNLGLFWGGVWIGLPFIIAAILYIVALFILSFV